MNAKDKGAETALHKAAVAGQNEMVELPIAEGADVNAQAMRGGGMTPLDMAIHLNKTETADTPQTRRPKTSVSSHSAFKCLSRRTDSVANALAAV